MGACAAAASREHGALLTRRQRLGASPQPPLTRRRRRLPRPWRWRCAARASRAAQRRRAPPRRPRRASLALRPSPRRSTASPSAPGPRESVRESDAASTAQHSRAARSAAAADARRAVSGGAPPSLGYAGGGGWHDGVLERAPRGSDPCELLTKKLGGGASPAPSARDAKTASSARAGRGHPCAPPPHPPSPLTGGSASPARRTPKDCKWGCVVCAPLPSTWRSGSCPGKDLTPPSRADSERRARVGGA